MDRISFEWDETKNRINQRKHGLAFEEAMTVFYDEYAILFDDPDQFVILTAPQPQHKVRYVQACVQDEGIEVELGIQEEGTRLFGKLCTEEECYRIFLDFL